MGTVCALVAVSLGVAGCSSAGSATKSIASNTAGTIPSAHSTASGGVTGTARRPVTDPRQAMARVSPGQVGAVGYGPASAGDTARLAAVTKASAGLLTSSAVRTLTVDGQDVGGVGVFGVKPGAAKSPTFRDQYVLQLVDAVGGGRSPARFVRAGGQVIALSTGSTPVAGWFQGDRVVLVYRQGSTPDLAALAVGVHARPPAH